MMTVRLSEDEEAYREALELHLGTDGSSVMRMGLLKLGRSEGIEFPLSKEGAAKPKGPAARRK